jgi:hypothetical protein
MVHTILVFSSRRAVRGRQPVIKPPDGIVAAQLGGQYSCAEHH